MQDEKNNLEQVTVHSSTQILKYALKCEVMLLISIMFFTLEANSSMVSLHKTDFTGSAP